MLFIIDIRKVQLCNTRKETNELKIINEFLTVTRNGSTRHDMQERHVTTV
jgi:hypothetical protein